MFFISVYSSSQNYSELVSVLYRILLYEKHIHDTMTMFGKRNRRFTDKDYGDFQIGRRLQSSTLQHTILIPQREGG